MKPVVNIENLKFETGGNGGAYQAQEGFVSSEIGLEGLGCTVTIIPAGKSAFPFHRHHVTDELFYILDGEGTYRYGDAVFPVRAGDFLSAAAGTEAHQIFNSSKQDLKFIAVSTRPSADILDYPENETFAFSAGRSGSDPKKSTIRKLGKLQPADYWTGEPTSETNK